MVHDCVILPNFGGFVSRVEPAYINEEGSAVMPPRRSIAFNGALTVNDGLFATFISMRERIPLSDASRRVSLLTDELRMELERGGSVTLGEVGTLSLDENQEILFREGEGNFYPGVTAADGGVALPPLVDRSEELRIPRRSSSLWRGIAWGGVAALIAVGLYFSILAPDAYRLDFKGITRSDKASFEPQFPFFPTTPGVRECTSVISPDCDYLDFVAEL